jgi:hypothetical protein
MARVLARAAGDSRLDRRSNPPVNGARERGGELHRALDDLGRWADATRHGRHPRLAQDVRSRSFDCGRAEIEDRRHLFTDQLGEPLAD